MRKLYYGNGQVQFETWEEYYYALGFLSNNRYAEIKWEHNEDQGAWTSEGRIHCLVPTTRFPLFFRFTAGRGRIYARINCNEYVENLVNEHCFITNSCQQDYDAILQTIPQEYIQSFLDGYNAR